MSIFRVYAANSLDYDSQFAGTVMAGKKFGDFWDENDADKTFTDFIFGLINQHNCTVTYKDDTNIVRTRMVGHQKELFYVAGGQEHRIHLQACKDKPNNDVVRMCFSRKVTPTEPYLAEAIGKLSDPAIGDTEKQAFLLGMLLLKRCR